MKTAVLTFSPQGATLAETYFMEADKFGKDFGNNITKSQFPEVFYAYDAIVFIGAVGIAVRYIAALAEDKRTDPAVIVIDPLGRYIIPILSGHLGGANALAQNLANRLQAQAIITTASDSLGFQSIDVFAKDKDYIIGDMGRMKKIAAAMVAEKDILWYGEGDVLVDYQNIKRVQNIKDADKENGVVVSLKSLPLKNALQLIPRRLHLGIGAKKNTETTDLIALIEETFQKIGLDTRALKAIHSIDIKKDEKAIVEAAEYYARPFYTYSAEILSQWEEKCHCSRFVKDTVGVGSVSCTSALMGAEKIIVEKVRAKGFTLTLTEEID